VTPHRHRASGQRAGAGADDAFCYAAIPPSASPAAESHPAMAAFAKVGGGRSAADDAATHLSQPETNADDPIGASLNRS